MRHSIVGYFFMMAFLCIGLGWYATSHSVQFKAPLTKSAPHALGSTHTKVSTILQTAITKVIDGDTVVTTQGQKIRYIGINAPETGQPFASQATMFNKTLVEGKPVTVVFDVLHKDQYGRLLGYVFVGNTFINGELLKNGLAIADTIVPNITRQNELLQDEQLAKSRCLGMWESLCVSGKQSCLKIAAIHYDAQGIDDQNLNDEWIQFENTCTTAISIQNWLLKDSSASNAYTFGNINLLSRASIKLHSGCGTNSSADLYWQCPQKEHAVWNNGGDEAMLFDSHGELLSVYKY